MGNITVQQPRVDDRREGHQFTSNILPPYLRRVASLENLIPALYLRGISTNNMRPALESILGDQAHGLSPANVTRICSCPLTPVPITLKRYCGSARFMRYRSLSGI